MPSPSRAGSVRSVRILGIDPGTIACGYGVVEVTPGRRPRYVECGVLELEERAALSHRLVQLARDLREILAELQPDEVALEAVFHGKNAQSALRLGHARGVAMLIAAEAELPLSEYPPATVKRAVAGHGRAQKAEVQRVVSWLCGLRTLPRTDAADALAIALCHGYHRGVPTGVAAAQALERRVQKRISRGAADSLASGGRGLKVSS